jgi:hypothetical protein
VHPRERRRCATTAANDLQSYLTALDAVRREVSLANIASHREAEIAAAGNFPALAASARQLGRHLARAAVAARAVRPPDVLRAAHASLVNAFLNGSHVAMRMSVLYATPGPASGRDYQRTVLPLQARTALLGDRWYDATAPVMREGGIAMPAWAGHLFDWA